MDLRFEMATSEEPSEDEGGRRSFINNQYRDGNTNKGFLLGNAVGRDARAFEGRAGYWLSAQNRIEVGYRQSKISEVLLPHGGTISDAFVNASYVLARDWQVSAFGQYESYWIPSLQADRSNNTSMHLQITWTPYDRVLLSR